jgi:hypothetical protein
MPATSKQGSPNKWNLSKAHTDPLIARGFQYSVRVWLYYIIMQAASSRCTKLNVRNVGQNEATHGDYARLKLRGGQAYDCSSE